MPTNIHEYSFPTFFIPLKLHFTRNIHSHLHVSSSSSCVELYIFHLNMFVNLSSCILLETIRRKWLDKSTFCKMFLKPEINEEKMPWWKLNYFYVKHRVYRIRVWYDILNIPIPKPNALKPGDTSHIATEQQFFNWASNLQFALAYIQLRSGWNVRERQFYLLNFMPWQQIW